jgi:hypothetical protein
MPTSYWTIEAVVSSFPVATHSLDVSAVSTRLTASALLGFFGNWCAMLCARARAYVYVRVRAHIGERRLLPHT